ncbi:MAG: ABC transporter permease subunit [Proteobacteria bacterium]|nr:ABC transporter permease subunit [Pseudomonadota bacterium]
MNYELYVFWSTLKQAVISTVLTIPLGVLIARALVWNHSWKWSRLCMKILGIPLITPALVGILGFITLMSGIFNVYSLAGIIAVHVIFYSPFAALFMINAWCFIPEEHYRLASQLGFSSFRIFYFIEFPQLKKTFIEVTWVCFCLFLNSFTTIMVLGGGPQKTTLSVALYQSFFFFYDPHQGIKFASLQLLLTFSLAMFTFAFKILPLGASLKTPTFSNLGSPFQKPIVLVTLAMILLPLGVVLIPALHAFPQTILNPLLWQSFFKSLSLGLCVGPLSAALSFLLVKHESIFTKPMASLYLLFSPALMGAGLFLVSLDAPQIPSEVFLIVFQLLIILPFSFRLLRGPYLYLQTTYKSTAQSLGLSSFQWFRLIEWPLLKKPLAMALGLGGALSCGDFQSLAFFPSSDVPGLSHLLYQQIARHFEEGLVTATVLLFCCYFLYQFPHWILKAHDRIKSS